MSNDGRNSLLTGKLRTEIQEAYTSWLKSMDCKPRSGQRRMMALIARTMNAVQTDADGHRVNEDGLVLIEAGTGIGKTLAYLLTLVPIARAMDKKLVIATATVALQEQIIDKDVPEVLKYTGLAFTAGLAKGRGRYLCPQRLEGLLEGGTAAEETRLLFVEENVGKASSRHLYEDFHQQFNDGRWDGERDHWPKAIADTTWSQVTSEAYGCTGVKCRFFSDCPFFKARRHVSGLDVTVTNHDLLLADLALGGGNILPQPRDALFVIDEGHKLPERTLAHFGFGMRIHQTARWLSQIVSLFGVMAQRSGRQSRLVGWATSANRLAEDFGGALETLGRLLDTLSAGETGSDRHGGGPVLRFSHGVVPMELNAAARDLATHQTGLRQLMDQAIEHLNDVVEGIRGNLDADHAQEFLSLFTTARSRFDGVADLLVDYAAAPTKAPEAPPPVTDMRARWVRCLETAPERGHHGFSGQDFALVSSPLVAAGILQERFWPQVHGAVVTSATLRELGRFEHFRMRAGVPDHAHEAHFESPFRYHEAAVLAVPGECAEGNDATRHTETLIAMLPELLARHDGTLVLFSSWRQLRAVREGLSDTVGSRILSQGDHGKSTILSIHRKRIDNGQASVLFGVASFVEGIDLPGNYCQHVIIAKLPFAVPDDPIHASLSERLELEGRNPFMELALPLASLRLVQASGRLLRKETDRGRITVLDRRILTRRYGRDLLAALPDFRRELG